jgi:hypothetical protein
MSKISNICGKSKIYTIENIEIEFKSNYVNIDDLPDLMSMSPENKDIKNQAEVMKNLAVKVLKKSIPDASDEEIKEFALRNLKAIMNAIVEISGINVTN